MFGLKLIEHSFSSPTTEEKSQSPRNNASSDIRREHAKLISISYDNSIIVWDTSDMSQMTKIKFPTSEVSAMDICDSNHLLVTGHDDGQLFMWNIDRHKSRDIKSMHKNTITTLKSFYWNRS